MPRLRELGEAEVVRRLVAARCPGAGVIVDAGDDAAILRPRPGADLVVTTDAFVEGIHVLDAWMSPEAQGARLAAANLSDIAAITAVRNPMPATGGIEPESMEDVRQRAPASCS